MYTRSTLVSLIKPNFKLLSEKEPDILPRDFELKFYLYNLISLIEFTLKSMYITSSYIKSITLKVH